MRTRLGHAARGDGGNITIIVLFMTLAIYLICALVFDAGNALTDRQRAADTAEQAARAGADAILPISGSSVAPTLNPTRARAAALAFLSEAAVIGTVQVTTDAVTVTVTIRHPTRLLSALGISTLTIKGTATARPVPGIVVAGGGG
jgi:Flp pilus assembly protein TadG